jgi:hypothetical protein
MNFFGCDSDDEPSPLVSDDDRGPDVPLPDDESGSDEKPPLISDAEGVGHDSVYALNAACRWSMRFLIFLKAMLVADRKSY